MNTKSAALAATLALVIASCGKVKDPTAKGTTLIDWNRSSAVTHDLSDPAKEGPKHPLADAKFVEDPKTRSFTVTVDDMDKKSFSFDLLLEYAKVSYVEDGKETTRWATTKVNAKLTSNDAFRVSGKCDNRVASLLGAPGEVTDLVIQCDVVGKRPNSMGDKDAITALASLQIEGKGNVNTDAKLVEH